jgi:hypothetical protein
MTTNDSDQPQSLNDLLNALYAKHGITPPTPAPLLPENTLIEITHPIGAIPAGATGKIIEVRPEDDKGRVYTVRLNVAKYGLTSRIPMSGQHPNELILSVTQDLTRDDVIPLKAPPDSN